MIHNTQILKGRRAILNDFSGGAGELQASSGAFRSVKGAGTQCSQPSNPSVFGRGRDGLWLVVRLFGGAGTDYARESKDRTDYRGL